MTNELLLENSRSAHLIQLCLKNAILMGDACALADDTCRLQEPRPHWHELNDYLNSVLYEGEPFESNYHADRLPRSNFRLIHLGYQIGSLGEAMATITLLSRKRVYFPEHPRRNVYLFLSHLFSLMSGGLGVIDCLDCIRADLPVSEVHCDQVRDGLQKNLSFAQILGINASLLTPSELDLLTEGENNGRLIESLQQILTDIEKSAAFEIQSHQPQPKGDGAIKAKFYATMAEILENTGALGTAFAQASGILPPGLHKSTLNKLLVETSLDFADRASYASLSQVEWEFLRAGVLDGRLPDALTDLVEALALIESSVP